MKRKSVATREFYLDCHLYKQFCKDILEDLVHSDDSYRYSNFVGLCSNLYGTDFDLKGFHLRSLQGMLFGVFTTDRSYPFDKAAFRYEIAANTGSLYENPRRIAWLNKVSKGNFLRNVSPTMKGECLEQFYKLGHCCSIKLPNGRAKSSNCYTRSISIKRSLRVCKENYC